MTRMVKANFNIYENFRIFLIIVESYAINGATCLSATFSVTGRDITVVEEEIVWPCGVAASFRKFNFLNEKQKLFLKNTLWKNLVFNIWKT